MSPSYTPAGFRRPPGRIIPINVRRRGLGQTAADFTALASQYPAGSALNQFYANLAQNPQNWNTPAVQQQIQMLQTPGNQPTITGAGGSPVFAATAPGQALATPAPAGTPSAVTADIFQPYQAPGTSSTPTVSTAAPASSAASVPGWSFPSQFGQGGNWFGNWFGGRGASAPASPTAAATAAPAATGLSTPLLGVPIWAWGLGVVALLFFFSGRNQ